MKIVEGPDSTHHHTKPAFMEILHPQLHFRLTQTRQTPWSYYTQSRASAMGFRGPLSHETRRGQRIKASTPTSQPSDRGLHSAGLSHQPSALNFHSQMSWRHRTKQAELIAAAPRPHSVPLRLDSVWLPNELTKNPIHHPYPFSTLLEMQFGGVLKSEVGVSVMGADHGRATVQSFHFRNACLSPAEISTLIPFLIPGKTGIWWEGNAAEGFCAAWRYSLRRQMCV